MLRVASAIAIPAFGLAWVLSQTDPAQRVSLVSNVQHALGVATPRAAAALPAAAPVPARNVTLPAPSLQAANVDSFAIDPDRAGQFQTTMQIGGRSLPALVDTGASAVSLTFEDAASLGFHPVAMDFRLRMMTANGETKAAPVTIPLIRVGNVEARNVLAVIAEPGALTTHNLLGMTFLRKLSGYQVDAGRMVLKQ